MLNFIFGKNDFKDFDRGEENCYLLTNGLGGFSSLTMIGSNARSENAILMASLKAPTERFNLVTNLDENILIDGEKFSLSSQRFVNRTKNKLGYEFLNSFSYKYLPQWTYKVKGFEIIKTIVMVNMENTVAVKYKIISHCNKKATFCITPFLKFIQKGNTLEKSQSFEVNNNFIISNNIKLFYSTNGIIDTYNTVYIDDLYYEQDARDGRDCVGVVAHNHKITFDITHDEEQFYIIYSTENADRNVEQLIENEIKRQNDLVKKSEIKNDIGQFLVKSANQYVTYRQSTNGKSIIAGFPFFGDWGRDTMIALIGCTICTKQFDDTKSILRTFISYCKNGLMPNIFPENDLKPAYNTVDASLLFIEAVYEYYKVSNDIDFIKEAYNTMKDIIDWYMKGTDYHIKMDTDNLIMAGDGLEQVTWMDVCINGILPTPRHGKPVEINAYWYNALMIMDCFSSILDIKADYKILADKVKISFNEKFWNSEENCLKDVLFDSKADNQIRCNQIWAVSMPFCILDNDKAQMVVKKVYENLYTPYGLRSLAMNDFEFHENYGGSQFDRDMAYHQGTVWAFPLGAYYLAYLNCAKDKKKAKATIYRQLESINACMAEGCIGHIAEIYDGKNPSISKGCFAQAWSVGEILRVYAKLEEIT